MKKAAGLLVAAVALFLAALPGEAAAHAALSRTEPSPNAFLQRPPGQVVLGFTEPIDPKQSGIRLLDAVGREVKLPAAEFGRAGTVSVQVPTLPPGIYNVLWFNLSSVDGHALRGSFPFTVLNPDGSVPDVTNTVSGIGSSTDPAPLADGVAVRALSLLGLLIVAGAAVMLLIVPGATPALRRWMAVAAYAGSAVLIAATLLNLEVLRTAYSSFSLNALIFETRAGGFWLTRLGAAFFIAFVVTLANEMPRRAGAGAAAGLAIYLFAYSATSHAAAGAGSAWGIGIDALHGASAVLWIGAVIGVALYARLAWRNAAYAPLMARFGLLASLLVFVLLATGLLSSFIEISSPSQLVDTRYGLTMTAKLALIVVLLAVAGYNARWGRRRLEALAAGEPRRFILTAVAEVALGMGVFVTAALLTQTSVAKSIAKDSETRVFEQDATVNGLTIGLKIDPNRTGLNTYRVTLLDQGGQPQSALRVRLTFRYQEDQTVGPATLDLAASSTAGTYSAQGPYLTLEGQWRVEVNVRRESVDDTTAFFDVRPAGAPLGLTTSGGRWDNPAPGMTWNTFGGIAVLLAGLGIALWRERLAGLRPGAGYAVNAGTVLAFGVGTLLLFGVHKDAPSGALPTNPIFPDQNSVATGQRLFEANCVACHGRFGVPPQGLNLNPYPLDLTVHVPQHPDGQLFNFINNGVPNSAMRAWGDGPGALSDTEIWHLVNFLRTLRLVEQ